MKNNVNFFFRHDNFIVSSSIFSSKNGGTDTVLLTNAPTRDYFKTIIEILIKLIPHPTSSLDLR